MASAFWRRVTVVVDIASQALARSGFSCGGGDDGDGGDSGDGGGDGGDDGGDGDDGAGRGEKSNAAMVNQTAAARSRKRHKSRSFFAGHLARLARSTGAGRGRASPPRAVAENSVTFLIDSIDGQVHAKTKSQMEP